MNLTFTVYGTPIPQGSMKAFMVAGRARVTSDNTKLKPFRSEVTRMAIATLAEANLSWPMVAEGPVGVGVNFYFTQPKSAKRRMLPTVKPDLDKLVRGILDALTGVAYKDDAQVCEITAVKYYGAVECAVITVWRV